MRVPRYDVGGLSLFSPLPPPSHPRREVKRTYSTCARRETTRAGPGGRERYYWRSR